MPLVEQRNIAVKLQRRFKVAGAPDRPAAILREALNMVTDADDAVRVRNVIAKDVDVSAGAATILTVPAGKRWYIFQIHKASAAGTPGVNLDDGGATNVVRLILGQAAAATWTGRLSCEEGWRIRLSQGAVGDTSINCGVMYEEEDI